MAASSDNDLQFLHGSLGNDLDTMLAYNLLRTHSYLGLAIEEGLRAQNLSAAQFNALLALRSAGADGLRMGEIGRRLVVTKSNVTGLIDRLERAGLAERLDAPDRRATAVKLTAAGRTLLNRAAPPHAALLSELAGCLRPGEKRTLIQLLTKLRRELRRRRGGQEAPATAAKGAVHGAAL